MLASTGLFPQFAWALNKAAFEAKSVQDVLKALGAGVPIQSKDVSVGGPDIAENGASVPLSAGTTLSGVKQMLIMIEKNPATLTALFNVTEFVEPSFSIRAKMAQSCDVYAVAIMADGKAYFAKREVRVTVGGCDS
jgi:sulfur-oxidizing protein SoxY